MKTIQNAAAFIFILAVAVLSTISVLGVWHFFSDDVISKSYQTIGLLGLVAIIVMIAGHFIEGRSQAAGIMVTNLPNPAFPVIRRLTLAILIIAVSLLAIVGVLAIWEVIQDKDVLYKTLGSLGIVAFAAFVMVLTCLAREDKLRGSGPNRSISPGAIVGLLILALFLVPWIFSLIR